MKIIAVGETTYDIFFREGKPVGSAVGGSQLNSAVTLGRCGLPIMLVSSAGEDPVGNLSVGFLLRNGVNTDYIRRFGGNSRIALAFFNEKEEASYSIYPASKNVVPLYPEPQSADIILFGSSFALREQGREELLTFLRKARECGSTILYDPNIRQDVARNPALKAMILQNIGLATIVKGSVEDFLQLFGTADARLVYREIVGAGASFLALTKGGDGAEFLAPGLHLTLPALPVKVVSTVGAGDNFSAGMICSLCRLFGQGLSIGKLTPEQWQSALGTATRFAAEVCQSEENYLPVSIATQL